MGDQVGGERPASKLRKEYIALAIIVIAGGALFGYVRWREGARQPLERGLETVNSSSNMKITSPAFEQDGDIPVEYTCDGQGGSPPLEFFGVPEGTKSLVLVVDDPDAPMGTWVHWTIWNIKPDAGQVAASSTPSGAVEGKTSHGRSGWGPPCPPSGTHHYFFKLYALDTMLDLGSSADVDALESAMAGHILDKAGLIGLYSRTK